MKKLFSKLLILSALLLSAPVFAQITYPEKRVALAPLSYDRSTATQASAEKLYHYLLDALFNTKRFTVVDRLEGYKRIVIEKKLQEGTDFIDGKVVAQGKQQGASLIIFAHVNVAQGNENKDANGKITGYSGDLSLFMRIIDVETGQVVASQIITPTGISTIGDEVQKQNAKGLNGILKGVFSGGCNGANPQIALENCMSKINVYIRQFVSDNFPIEMRIHRYNDLPDGKRSFLLMGAGEGNNLKINQRLSIIRTTRVDVGGGKMLKYVEEVMKVKIVDTNGEFMTAQAIDKKERTKEPNLLATLKSDPTSIKVIEIK